MTKHCHQIVKKESSHVFPAVFNNLSFDSSCENLDYIKKSLLSIFFLRQLPSVVLLFAELLKNKLTKYGGYILRIK